MISSLFIANRGEIACRVIRTGLFLRLLPLLALVGCAPAGAQAPAWQAHSLEHGGTTRSWSEVVPPACTARTARCPVLVALHGGGGAGVQVATTTGLAAEGAARGYVVLAPDGIHRNWNDGRPEIAAGIDDVGFIRAMLADLRGRIGVDSARIFATGPSNGGLMSYRLACEGDGLFRAVAPVIANMSPQLIAGCRPSGPVSMFMIQGTVDPLMPYAGGPVASRFGDRGTVVSADRTLEFWRNTLECRGAPRTERFDPVPDATAVAIIRYDGCRGGAVLVRWTVEGGGHTWPGVPARLGARVVGPTATEFSATDAILRFFDAAGQAGSLPREDQ